ncbi:hypothetical protein XI08_16320 [Bradyrhizobium sp. CCBAU 11361]|nr:hypothetical protein [Bradyrhizobium sp. CCBAU 11361]
MLAAISFFASLWVHLRWDHPAEFVYAGSHPRRESAASFILAYPAFQVILSAALGWQVVRWPAFYRAATARAFELKTRDERFSQLDVIALISVVSCLVVAVNIALLMSTIYRIWMLASGA